MHKTGVDFTDEQVMDLAAAVRTRIEFLRERISPSYGASDARKAGYQAEFDRQHALYTLLIGSSYDA